MKNTLRNVKLLYTLLSFIFLIAALLFTNDYLTSIIFNKQFHLQETLLFKIPIILLVIPTLIYTSRSTIKHSKEINIIKLLYVLVPLTILHVLMASYIIQFVSLNFLNSPFTFAQLIQSKFTQDFVFILTTYGLMYLIARYYYLNLTHTHNKTISIKTGTRIDIINIDDIDWIAAETPYIAIWEDEKKYLYHSTLHKILKQLNHPSFVRIHRTTIVNLNKISTITSRLNGDYDIHLYNRTQLRLSRTYRTPELDSQLKL
ncbi:MAG: LytTR family DNA-binding domain-containing protein [Marinicellaceae bacterium]